jgi:dihydrolipoamide dehydrogenase
MSRDLGVTFGEPRSTCDKLLGAQEQGRGQAHRRPGRDGQDAQGPRRARLRQLRRPAPREVEVTEGRGPGARPGKKQVIRFEQLHRRRRLARRCGCPSCPTTACIVDSTGALLLRSEARRSMLVIGGGIIGLEMGTVYSTLGARLDVVEMLDGLMQGADRDLVKVWQKMNARRFDRIMTQDQARWGRGHSPRASACGSRAITASRAAASTTWCCRPWDAAQRRQDRCRAAGVAVTDRGFIPVDVADAHERAARVRDRRRGRPADARAQGGPRGVTSPPRRPRDEKSHFDARVIPSVAYTDPEVAWAGLTEEEATKQGVKLGRSGVPVGRVGPCDRQRSRRGLHQAAVRRDHAPDRRRRRSSARTRAT